MFAAPPGFVFVGVDYAQIEARVIAVVAQDQPLLEAIRGRYDIHLAWANRIAELHPPALDASGGDIKKLRYHAKNKLVFPLFYGATMYGVQQALGIPKSVASVLRREFWDQFRAVQAWQKTLLDGYARTGYVTSPTGFRRHAPLTVNQILNTGIQGAASDILVDAAIRLCRRAHDEGRPELRPVMSIHDDLSFFLPEPSLQECIREVVREMVACPFPWCSSVPMAVEVSMGPNWADQTKVGVYELIDKVPTLVSGPGVRASGGGDLPAGGH
jgi:DNA polymerase-1